MITDRLSLGRLKHNKLNGRYFDPREFGKFTEWFDFTDNRYVLDSNGKPVSSGGAIQKVFSKISSNYLEQTSGTLQGLYTSNIVNGHSVARFDGTDDGMLGVGFLNLCQNVGGCSIFIVWSPRSGFSSDIICGFTGNASYEDRLVYYIEADSTRQVGTQRVDGAGTSYRAAGTPTGDVWYADIIVADYTNALSWAYSNGASILASGASSTSGVTSNTASAKFQVAYTTDFGGYTGLIDVAMIALAPEAIPETRCAGMTGAADRMFNVI